jgi:nicotinate dehydrogenase subunit A
MPQVIEMTVNGKRERVEAEPDTPLLYVLRNDLGSLAPKFGCGLAQCGACTVHLDGTAIRSCATPVSSAANAKVTTLEGLAPRPGTLHAVQQAFIDEQAAQCGYCINGWIMTAAALLESNPRASEDEIRRGLSGLKCRCGTHMSILRAVKLAASRMAAGGNKA